MHYIVILYLTKLTLFIIWKMKFGTCKLRILEIHTFKMSPVLRFLKYAHMWFCWDPFSFTENVPNNVILSELEVLLYFFG